MTKLMGWAGRVAGGLGAVALAVPAFAADGDIVDTTGILSGLSAVQAAIVMIGGGALLVVLAVAAIKFVRRAF